MLLAELRKGTARLHNELEGITLGHKIQDGTLTFAEYRKIIHWQLAAHQFLEPGILAQAAGFNYQSRISNLKKDAADLALPIGSSLELPTQKLSPTAQLGRLYVMVGASLGGTAILKALRSNDTLQEVNNFHFYTFQQEQGLPEWRQLIARLKTVEFSPDEIEECVAEAQQTFLAFKQVWGN